MMVHKFNSIQREFFQGYRLMEDLFGVHELVLCPSTDFDRLRLVLKESWGGGRHAEPLRLTKASNEDFWIAARDPNGLVVALCITHVFWTSDFIELFESEALRNATRSSGPGKNLVCHPTKAKLSGKVSWSAYTRINQNWRGTGLGIALTWAARFMALGDLGSRSTTAMIRGNLASAASQARAYGYDHLRAVAPRWLRHDHGAGGLFLGWSSAHETAEALESGVFPVGRGTTLWVHENTTSAALTPSVEGTTAAR